jgi:hypothetical protein
VIIMDLIIAFVLTGLAFVALYWLDSIGSKMPATKDPSGNDNIGPRKPQDYL